MSIYPKIILQKEKERSVQRYHPWIFSGAIQTKDSSLSDGDIVEVTDNKGAFLCIGHFYHGSIAIKILSFNKEVIDQHFWDKKISDALQLRQSLGLIDNKETTCFRLIHAEGDHCPGLVVDIYSTTAVIQCHSIGMHRNISAIAAAIKKEVSFVENIYDKSKENLPAEYASDLSNQFIIGDTKEIIVRENGHTFYIDVERGQKTGFFLDQRNNRALLTEYCRDKNILNTYAYSGGFSVYAMNNHAKKVISVDVSKTAMELLEKNIALNPSSESDMHQSYCEDVFQFLKHNEEKFDVIILDPPAFAKSINKRHNAVQAYKRLNAEGLKKINKGGIIFTFSCSQVVDRALFNATVMSAAIEANREVRVLHYLSQPPDHPMNIFHPEGSYLKGLVLYVN